MIYTEITASSPVFLMSVQPQKPQTLMTYCSHSRRQQASEDLSAHQSLWTHVYVNPLKPIKLST